MLLLSLSSSSVILLISCFFFSPFHHPLYHSPCVVAEGPYQGVVKLQKMRCLFEAYEHVLSLLENVFTPMFCHSDEVIGTGYYFSFTGMSIKM